MASQTRILRNFISIGFETTDGTLGFFGKIRRNNNNNNKLSSGMRSVSFWSLQRRRPMCWWLTDLKWHVNQSINHAVSQVRSRPCSSWKQHTAYPIYIII